MPTECSSCVSSWRGGSDGDAYVTPYRYPNAAWVYEDTGRCAGTAPIAPATSYPTVAPTSAPPTVYTKPEYSCDERQWWYAEDWVPPAVPTVTYPSCDVFAETTECVVLASMLGDLNTKATKEVCDMVTAFAFYFTARLPVEDKTADPPTAGLPFAWSTLGGMQVLLAPRTRSRECPPR